MKRLIFLTLLCLCCSVLPALFLSSAQSIKLPAHSRTTNYDIRSQATGFNYQYQTRFSYRWGSTLTPPSDRSATEIANQYLLENSQNFGLSASEIAQLKLAKNYRSQHNGLSHVSFDQYYQGLKIFGAQAGFTITSRGELLAASNGLVANPSAKIDQLEPLITAHQALQLAAQAIELKVDQIDHRSSDPVARLVLFPVSARRVRLAWELRLQPRRLADHYDIIIDAETGRLLLKYNLTWYLQADTPSYRVYTGDSPRANLPFKTSNPTFVERALVQTNGDPIASPNGWVDSDTTAGNNVVAQADLTGRETGGFQPQAINRQFDFPLVLGDPAQGPNNFAAAAVTNLFYWCNVAHDHFYQLGFDEAAGNFQQDNFGRGGVGFDPVIADAQDGLLFDNESFGTSEDGFSPRLEVYLWKTAVPLIDGDYDVTGLLHEYTHGVTTRLVGGPNNVVSLFGLQSSGMSEGWSDWYALSMLAKPGDDPHGVYPIGQYVVQDFARGIRRFPYSTDLQIDPLTFFDIDPQQTNMAGNAAEPHNMGEVWCLALWEVRANLIDAYGFETGSRLAEQLVTDSLQIMPINPSFLDGRDAILLADQADNNGVNQCLIWQGFAKRGMGFSAWTPNSSVSQVRAAFDLPPYCQQSGTIKFDRVGYSDGEMATIMVGDSNLAGQAQLTIKLTSSGGDQETIQLLENDRIAGLFIGTIAISQTDSVINNGRLEATIGGTFMAQYDDAADQSGNPASISTMARSIKTVILFQDNFEQGINRFVASGWQQTTADSHSPNHSWTDNRSTSNGNGDLTLTTPPFQVSGMINTRLSFWQKYSLAEDLEFGYLEIKLPHQKWQTLRSFSGQSEFHLTEIDLSQYDGIGKIKLRFRLPVKANVSQNDWYIDDLMLTAGTN